MPPGAPGLGEYLGTIGAGPELRCAGGLAIKILAREHPAPRARGLISAAVLSARAPGYSWGRVGAVWRVRYEVGASVWGV